MILEVEGLVTKHKDKAGRLSLRLEPKSVTVVSVEQ
jgi:hypothetical protein